ncbi:hypothetical protein EB796_011388 [Bugula neritina]|uniref:Uncharacterized protein n=1 Tax=Bugula neritina TaxID=10212 RepID=A0A7J7JYA7_BUGNE|nr:hypothetical protein EB796_011388 [Bugula neritina]
MFLYQPYSATYYFLVCDFGRNTDIDMRCWPHLDELISYDVLNMVCWMLLPSPYQLQSCMCAHAPSVHPVVFASNLYGKSFLYQPYSATYYFLVCAVGRNTGIV